MKVRSAAIAAFAAAAIGAGALAPGASAWEQCPPGSHDPQYCEQHHHHHHHHHRHHRGWNPYGYYARWGASLGTSTHF